MHGIRIALALTALPLSALILIGCSAPASEPAPDAPDPGTDAGDTMACEVGTWQLDVADYEAQFVAFLADLDVPVTDYALSGSGTLEMTELGELDGEVDLRSTGVIAVPGAAAVEFDVPSAYTFSALWIPGEADGTLDIDDWTSTADVDTSDPTAPPILDFENVPTITSDCSADSMRLQGPDAPLSAFWHRV